MPFRLVAFRAGLVALIVKSLHDPGSNVLLKNIGTAAPPVPNFRLLAKAFMLDSILVVQVASGLPYSTGVSELAPANRSLHFWADESSSVIKTALMAVVNFV